MQEPSEPRCTTFFAGAAFSIDGFDSVSGGLFEGAADDELAQLATDPQDDPPRDPDPLSQSAPHGEERLREGK